MPRSSAPSWARAACDFEQNRECVRVDERARAGRESSTDRQSLTLSSGEVVTSAGNLGVPAIRQVRHEPVCIGRLRGVERLLVAIMNMENIIFTGRIDIPLSYCNL